MLSASPQATARLSPHEADIILLVAVVVVMREVHRCHWLRCHCNCCDHIKIPLLVDIPYPQPQRGQSLVPADMVVDGGREVYPSIPRPCRWCCHRLVLASQDWHILGIYKLHRTPEVICATTKNFLSIPIILENTRLKYGKIRTISVRVISENYSVVCLDTDDLFWWSQMRLDHEWQLEGNKQNKCSHIINALRVFLNDWHKSA